MSIETNCDKCGTKLTVSSALKNSDVRCPQCDYVFRVESEDLQECVPDSTLPAGHRVADEEAASEPVTETDLPRSPPTTEPTEWYLRVPEGRVYGPVAREVLDKWVTEGRVSSDCGLRNDVDEAWASSTETYPMLAEDGNPFGFAPTSDSRSLVPHRGKLIFSLAIVGCIVPFVSLWPAIMGTRDLRQMNLGKMNPSGDVLTRAGQAIAMVSSMIWGGAFGVALLVMLIRLA